MLKFLEKVDGQYLVDVIPATDKDLEAVKAVLTDKMYGGADRFKDADIGSGKSFQLARKHNDKHIFKDRETGEDKEYDFGGEPEIVWWNDEKGRGTKFTLQDDGFIGNDTLAKVKFSVYMGDSEPTVSDTVRLEKIGIVDHVKYETQGGDGF